MNKRKALSLLLAGTMVAGLLAGCGNGTQNNNETPDAQNSPAAGGGGDRRRAEKRGRGH